MAASSNAFVKSLIDASGVQTEAEVQLSGSGKSYHTVAISFGASLAGLLEELSATDAGALPNRFARVTRFALPCLCSRDTLAPPCQRLVGRLRVACP